MVARRIPIQNLYYLLCYAWDVLPEAEIARVSAESEMRSQDLLARVLITGVARLLKQGMDRAYVAERGEIAGVKGRLDISESVKHLTFPRARAWCVYDEFSPDVPHNRIIKATLRALAAVRKLDRSLAEELRDLYRRMPEVGDAAVTSQSFRRVVLGRSNARYAVLLDVCELVHENLLVDEKTGELAFRDFSRDDKQMARVFEKFLLRFFAREQSVYKVSAPRLRWRAEGEVDQLAFLPVMRTDIVLSTQNEMIVIDAKYYTETLSEHLTKRSIRAAHLYQLFAYLSHLSARGQQSDVRGMLLYPRTTESVSVKLNLCGYPFTAATINLAQPWSLIQNELLGLLPLGN